MNTSSDLTIQDVLDEFPDSHKISPDSIDRKFERYNRGKCTECGIREPRLSGNPYMIDRTVCYECKEMLNKEKK